MVYIGGKKNIAKFICPILQEELDKGNYKAYIEPFAGGGNVIENIKYPHKIFNDINYELIEFYKKAIKGWEIPLPNSFGPEHYNEVKKAYKENYEAYEPYYYGYMMTIPSYNGKIWGSFAKDGSRLYQKEHYESIINQIPLIKDCTFTSYDYKTFSNCENCLIYCDPPYADSKKNYYDKNFDTEEFWEWCRLMSKKNKIFISETAAPQDYIVVWEKPYKRTVANQAKAIKTVEKLFTI